MRPSLSRLVPTAGVALTVALLGFGAVGLATAASGVDAAPATFRLAERHGGDRGSYDWSFEVIRRDGSVETSSSGTQDFQWLEEEAWFDGATGLWHAAHPRLVVERQYVDSEFAETFLAWTWTETATLRPLGASWRAQFEYAWGGSVQGPLNFATTASAHDEFREWQAGEPCVLDEALRAGVTFGEPLEVLDPCLAQNEAGPTPLRFTMHDADLDGIPTVRFEADAGNVTIAIDYTQALPEPVREMRTSRDDRGHVHQSIRRLTSFTNGTSPWDTGLAGSLPVPATLPAIELAPRQPWGPDESGVEHPFPASHAWQAALEDSDVPELREFMARNPGALARRSEYEEARDGNQTTRTWTFFVADEDDAILVRSWQEHGAAAASQTDLLGLAPTPVPVTATNADSYGAHGWCSNDPAAELPTVASVLARWRAYPEAAGGQGNAWGLDCASEGDLVSAGAMLATTAPRRAPDFLTGTARNGTTASSMLDVWQDGTPRGFATLAMRHDESTAVSPRAAPVVNPGPARPQQQHSPLLLAGGWVAPDPPVASGAAAVSLLAGLLYWLWPLLKAGPAGLFSRIQAPRLLEHPTRRAIADAVDANPGIHYQAIVRLVPGGKGAIDHHLNKLVDAGLLVRHKGPGYTCYFPPNVDRRVTPAAAALKSEGARRVLAAVQASPGATPVQLAASTGLDASTVSHHVHRLAAAGLLSATKVGRSLVVQPTFLAGQVSAAAA